MSDQIRCGVCNMTHFKDEPCPSCSGETAPRGLAPEPHIPYAGPLPSKDPYVQEYRERYGRAAQEELYPECDPLDGERR